MESETISTPQMIVSYEWILENVEEKTTIASKMILFRGNRVFRVGMKIYAKSAVLFFMAVDFSKTGMKVKDVKVRGLSNVDPERMTQMVEENIGDGGSLQLFTIPDLFVSKVDETDETSTLVETKLTIVFRICIEGTDPGYSYQLSDRLAKDQLWAALKNQQNLADVELIVKDKSFPAHKAILAARSQVFADEFEKKQPGINGPHHQIQIDGVEPSTVENFLHFVYTGEPKGTLADEDLRKLADRYGLTTLSSLCKHALKKMDAMQMENLRKSLNSNAEGLSSSKIMPAKETEIFYDRTTPTLRSTLTFQLFEFEQSKCVLQYQNENICSAYYTGEEYRYICSSEFVTKPIIHLSCAKHRSFGFKVEDIYCGMKGLQPWSKMEAKNCQKDAELLHFTVEAMSHFISSIEVLFDIKTISTIGNYYYEMMDDKWLTDLWLAATNRKLTDVEIFVGNFEMMEVHRVILCARSPVLNESLKKINNPRKSIISFGAEFDVDTVKDFLNFLYTGSLKSTDGVHQLSQLATMYQVETLKNVCQQINRAPDVEELTDCLIQL